MEILSPLSCVVPNQGKRTDPRPRLGHNNYVLLLSFVQFPLLVFLPPASSIVFIRFREDDFTLFLPLGRVTPQKLFGDRTSGVGVRIKRNPIQ